MILPCFGQQVQYFCSSSKVWCAVDYYNRYVSAYSSSLSEGHLLSLLDGEHLSADTQSASDVQMPQVTTSVEDTTLVDSSHEEPKPPRMDHEHYLLELDGGPQAISVVEDIPDQTSADQVMEHVSQDQLANNAETAAASDDERGSELSSLSDLTDPDEEVDTVESVPEASLPHSPAGPSRRSRRAVKHAKGTKGTGDIVLAKGKALPGGTLVWAKAGILLMCRYDR